MSGTDPAALLDSEASRVRVLVVCEANICRSPAGQLLLADRLGAAVVTSAGVLAAPGRSLDPTMRDLLEQARGRVPPWKARRLSARMIGSADLVLTMTLDQRAAVLESAPNAVRRTFCLREFARLCTLLDLPAEPRARPWGATIARAAAMRSALPQGSQREFDVEDPHGRDLDCYRATLLAIETAVEAIAAVLAV